MWDEQLENYKVWEPEPPNLGDTVRVSLGECPHLGVRENLIDHTTQSLNTPHPNVMNNQIGVVARIDRSARNGHYYLVVFFSNLNDGKDIYVAAEFAAIELAKEELTISKQREKVVRDTCARIGIDYPSSENT